MTSKSTLFIIATVLVCVGAEGNAAEPNAALKSLIAAANKEGELNLVHGQSVIGGATGARLIEEKMNAMFGTKIKVRFTPGPSMHRQTRRLLLEFKAGKKANADALVGWPPTLQTAIENGILDTVNWAGLLPDRIRPEIIEGDGRVLRMGVTIPVIVYNKQKAPSVPKTLADMLRPEWKGKFAITPYVAGYPMLAAKDVWGEKKTVEFLQKLSANAGGLIRCGAEVERVATGEYAALAMDCITGNTLLWQKRGAPLDFVIPADAAELHYYYLAVLKHAKNPNAAKLFTVFMLTDEGQKINWETWRVDLDGMPGSKMQEYISKVQSQNIKMVPVTMTWWMKHPELPKIERKLMKIVRKK